MKLSSIGEFGLIEMIRTMVSRNPSSVLIGIGDDAAALKVHSSSLLLATTDMLLEDVHFDLSYTDFNSLGWKAAAVNLSDIAAMGGIPRFCLISLGIPSSVSVRQMADFYDGFGSMLRTHRTALVGGDTCSSRSGVVINVTVLGETEKKRIITRAGAKRADRIFVTGTLGDSAAGMELLRKGARGKGPGTWERKLIQKHLRPAPRVEWGRMLARAKCASAMIDISDGLSSDLAHICEESGIGAELFSDALPFSEAFRKSADQLSKPPLHYALSGGEDYELLFTVPLARMKALKALDIPVTEIGTITRGHELLLVNDVGEKNALQPAGYNHFKRSKGARNTRRRSSA